MDDDPLLGSHVVLEATLTSSCALNFLAEGQSIELEELEHLVCLRLASLAVRLHDEKSRLEPMGQDEANGAKAGHFDALTRGNKVLAEDGAGERNVAQYLPIHEV